MDIQLHQSAYPSALVAATHHYCVVEDPRSRDRGRNSCDPLDAVMPSARTLPVLIDRAARVGLRCCVFADFGEAVGETLQAR
jgi:hypothetical protein